MIDFASLWAGSSAAYLFAIGGLIVLFMAGEWVVRGASGLAREIGVSELLIGLVVIAFGTSSPELIVAIAAVLREADDVAVGNVVGSNIANVLLVLGIGAMICPILARRNVFNRDGVVMLASTGFLILLGYGIADIDGRTGEGLISATAGTVLVSGLVIYLLLSYVMERKRQPTGNARPDGPVGDRIKIHSDGNGRSLATYLLLLLLGLLGLFLGAEALVYGAVTIAETYQVPQAIIGATLVAFGTSVPELAAVSIAAFRGHPQMALGSVVGSNIFNVLFVLGLSSMVAPITIATTFMALDMWVMLGAVLVLLVFLWSGGRLTRLEGFLMVLGYLGYVSWLFFSTEILAALPL